jgi:hypothetical protein
MEKIFMEYLIIISVLFWVTPFVLCLYDKYMGTHYSCSIFGWHDGKGNRYTFDGCSIHSTCSKCCREVMQDGQGNWF